MVAEANVIYEAERCSGTFKEHMIIRHVTGARGKVSVFEDMETGKVFRVINTHLDHECAGARKLGLAKCPIPCSEPHELVG